MQFKYHGNYGGPGYTGGKFVSDSEPGDYNPRPVDRLDAAFRAHDYGYETGSQRAADRQLINDLSFGFDKEGLAKTGFILKDLFINPFISSDPPTMVKNAKKQKVKGVLGPVAVKNGKQVAQIVKQAVRQQAASSSSRMGYMSGPSLSRNGGVKHPGREPFIVKDDEYICEINGTTSTTTPGVIQLPIQPGNSTAFPFLSNIAKNYEKWYFIRLEYYYLREVSEYNQLGTEGKVIFSVDYDAGDAGPTTKQQALDYWEHTSFMPSATPKDDRKVAPKESTRLCLDPAMLCDTRRGKFVRSGNLAGGADIKTYDGGNLWISTLGNYGTGVLGELHVSYECALMEPILPSSVAQAPINNSVSLLTSVAAGEAVVTATDTTLAMASIATNGLGVTNTSGSITVPAGNYLIDASVMFVGTAAASTGGYCWVNWGGSILNPSNSVGSANDIYFPTGTLQEVYSTSPSFYVTAAGSTIVQLHVNVGFSSGTMKAYGTLRIVAI